MEDLLGITALLFVATLTLFLGILYPKIRLALWVAFAIRTGAALFHYYVAVLPGGGKDEKAFERVAWMWASGGVSGVLENVGGRSSYQISCVIGFLYALVGRSPLMAQSLSLLAGMGTVLICWQTAKELWGEFPAKKALWFAAIFPMHIQYSALTLREPYAAFFLMVGVLGVVRWKKGGGYGYVLWAMVAFMGSTYFHGGMFGAVATVFGLVAWDALSRFHRALRWGRIHLIGLMVLVGLTISVLAFVQSGAKVPEIGSFAKLPKNMGRLITAPRLEGEAQYPTWMFPSNHMEYLWAVPLRIAYLLFAPFPWDIQKPSHLFALFDAMLYCYLVGLILINRKAIWRDPSTRAVFLITLSLIVIYAVGCMNFGTGLRHRVKFVMGLIVLAAPRI